MMSSLVSEAQVIQWQWHKKQLEHSADNSVRFHKNHPGGKLPSVAWVRVTDDSSQKLQTVSSYT